MKQSMDHGKFLYIMLKQESTYKTGLQLASGAHLMREWLPK